MVTEFMSDGGLINLIQRKGRAFTGTDLLAMSLHAAAGMKYLEQRKILHRDIALRNLLVTQVGSDHKYLVKVSYFKYNEKDV
jgi:serine/threonine protein kinase